MPIHQPHLPGFEARKLCTGCDRDLSPEEFSPNQNRPDGLQPYCRACNTLRVAKWRRDHPQAQQRITKRQTEKRRRV